MHRKFSINQIPSDFSGIRDNMTLMYADYSKIQIDRTIKNLAKVLDQQELAFIQTQEEIYKEKLQKNVEMALKIGERSITLLKKCKEWGGPWTEFQELQTSVKKIINL